MQTHTQPHETHAGMEACVQNCEACHHICLQTVAHCLSTGGKHAEQAHITLLLNCAEICQTSANFMLLSSALHGLTCGVCAEICERCAEDCERFGPDDVQMQECARICRECAESCRTMAREAMRSLLN